MAVQVSTSSAKSPHRFDERETMESGSCPAERIEPDPPLNSKETPVKQNRAYPVDRGAKTKRRICTDLQPAPWARTNFLIISLCLILFLIILPVVWLVKTRQADPIFAAASCPDGWVGYLGRCYYFSEAEGDWNNSQSSCSSLGASLAGIDNEQEKAFMLRYKGPADHWIGLHRALGQPWKWANGTEFNNWFEIKGGGLCAYMNSDAIASSGCLREGHWVCSRPAEKTEGNACG